MKLQPLPPYAFIWNRLIKRDFFALNMSASLASNPVLAKTLPQTASSATATCLLRLRDGRVLEFAEYGDAQGTPALFFHGFIGSHHQASLAHPLALACGVRLVALNRPGVGRSSPAHHRKISDTAGDVAQLVDALQIDEFAAVGVSAGGPYALACAHQLRARVRVAVIASGLGPMSDPRVLRRMSAPARLTLLLGRHFPSLARWGLEREFGAFRSRPHDCLARFIRRWSRADQELFAQPRVRAMFEGDLTDVLVRGEGEAGLARELRLNFRWGFRLHELPRHTKVFLWHGREDNLVPPFMTTYMAARIPSAEVIFRPGGHFAVLNLMADIIRTAHRAFLEP